MALSWSDLPGTTAWVAAQLARIPTAAIAAAELRANAEHARWIVAEATTLLTLTVIAATGAARPRRWIPPAARGWEAGLAQIVGVLTVLFIARLAAALAAARLWPLGAPTDATSAWRAVIDLALAILAAVAAYRGLATVGRGWPAPAVALAIGLPLTLLILIPAELGPRLRRDQPAPPSAVADALLALVHRGGAPTSVLYVFDNPDPTACEVTGWGASVHVAVSRAMLAGPLNPESEAALAHVLAHARYRDLWTLALLSAAVWSGGVLAAGAAAAGVGGRLTDARGVADPAGLPLVLLVLVLTGLALRPAYGAVDQAVNYRADAYALTLTGDPDALARWVVGQRPLAPPDPGLLDRLFFYGHPPLIPRLTAMARWRAEHGRS